MNALTQCSTRNRDTFVRVANSTGTCSNKRSCDGQACTTGSIENIPNSKGSDKRMKPCSSGPTRRVTFPLDDAVLIIRCHPYESGISDAEAIKLYRNDIWYTKNDYDSFMQDRIDTIRVYRSVNGNMTGLHDFYCMHGLEHFLTVDQQLKNEEHSQKWSITSARTGQLLQELSQPTCMMSSKDSALCTDYNVQTLNSAIIKMLQRNETMSEKHVNTGTIAGECKFVLQVDNTKKVEPYGGIPLSSTMRRKPHPVDMKSLRMMNMELLKNIRAKPDSKTKSQFSTNEDDIRKGIDMISSLQQHTILDSSQRGKVDFNSTLLNVMNRAIQISNVFVDPSIYLNTTIEMPTAMTPSDNGDDASLLP